MVAVEDFTGSATLVAVTVTVLAAEITAGGVYRPLEIVPVAELSFHVTVPKPIPVTDAVNCCVWVAFTVALAGLTETLTQLSVTGADADLVVSAALVAVTVTV